MKLLIVLLCTALLSACSARGPQPGAARDVAALAASLQALSPDVDPAEARRAAALSYETTFRLAQAYGITDPALIHNAKVNAGLRPRGLCYHWAEDMQARLSAENFRTLGLTRAIANSETRLLIDHSTLVIVAKGDVMENGVVIDPWRYAGKLFWAPVRDDTRYEWLRRKAVLEKRGLIRYAQRTEGSLAPLPAD
ncbi:Lipoprotein [Sulfitobacter noctilucicola]|uniref:Outer membrane murein-binding lipoprotein Lpp n=1 Tax=Sulfitobacter noctilucicola TaxID=1342301 RepID=A0A7W6M7Q2_9RHOB|nr:hypothetical protein [Sulfitobacter noctilucicola]KIN64871.1 Lipoprotein [Sulfitobacter noctilucicola]MBB4173985.1 outer membrane murein-binding lipoprotein Lpp [Sulfitobacter noctilucicola]